jgi:hypothetical protein
MMAMLMVDDAGAGDGVREPGGVEEGRQEDHHRCHGSGLPLRPGRETGRHEEDIIWKSLYMHLKSYSYVGILQHKLTVQYVVSRERCIFLFAVRHRYNIKKIR